MTSREDAPPQIYIPALRKEFAGLPLPDGVLLLDPGLPHTGGADLFFTPAAYPLSPDAAARALAELLSLGETLDLANPKNAGLARAALPEYGLSPEESGDLAAFAAKTGPLPSPDAPPSLLAAQKILLLAHDLETRLVEIRTLAREVAETALPLALALGDPAAEDAASGPLATLLPDIPDTAGPDWRVIVTAMAAFLPEEALLVTAHEGMRDALRESGMLLPLPEESARQLGNWPDSLKESMLWARAPLWRLLGHARIPANAPWLAKSPEIFVCSPKKKNTA